MPDPVYLDFAATSALRPAPVADAVAEYLRGTGATPGRGGHALAVEAGRVALRCRHALAETFGIEGDPGRIAFQFNATHALNTALYGLLSPGDRVVRTEYDHNAVRRPIAALASRDVWQHVLSGTPEGDIDLDELDEALAGDGRPAKLLTLPHASNVLGSVLPVREMADRAKRHGTLVLLDAAQSAGHLPIDVDELGIDLLAFTGHKGLLGPQGTGGLWVRDGLEVEPLLRGGTGGDSAPSGMPVAMPDRLEAGTQNAPGLAGLLAALHWLHGQGIAEVHERESRLKRLLLSELRQIDGLRVRSPDAPDGVGIVTLTADALDAASLAGRLASEHGIMTRAGLHCAPESHHVLGTSASGAVRFSLGWASTENDVRAAADAVRHVLSKIEG